MTFRTDSEAVGRWREIPPGKLAGDPMLMNAANSYLRTYRLGDCTVIVTRGRLGWHLSIAHPSRYPTWDEVATARYNAIPDGVTMAMLLPPRGKYVNVHRHCFQLMEITR